LFDLPLLCQRFVQGEHMSKPELDYVYRQADIYRKRLMSISWFMNARAPIIKRLLSLRENHHSIFGCAA
jgi:hypothetical protein